MILAYFLSMPNNNAWNGKWTGQGKPYVIVKNYGRSNESIKKASGILDIGSCYYNFGDGWGASVAIKKVDAKEASRLRRKSAGFCGYNWMVKSIETHGDIRI